LSDFYYLLDYDRMFHWDINRCWVAYSHHSIPETCTSQNLAARNTLHLKGFFTATTAPAPIGVHTTSSSFLACVMPNADISLQSVRF